MGSRRSGDGRHRCARVSPVARRRPKNRGRLLTGHGERYMHHVAGGGGGQGDVADHTLWWPPSKVAGRRLAPYLAARDEPWNRGRGPGMAGLAVQTDLARELSAASA